MSENLNPIVLEVEEVRVINAVSPTVDLGRTESGALVSIHDYRGTQTVEILDGPVGPQGPQGESGAETAKAIVEEAISRMEDSIHDAQTIGQTVAGYRDAAAQSASNAALSKDAAALSAQAAEQSNQSSAGHAQTAGTQAGNAAQSAQAASGSATAAAGSASNAAQSETNARNSAQAASQSAQAASQSATNAATSERNAADSAQDAQDVLDSIPEDYSTLSEDVTDLKSAFDNASHVMLPDYCPQEFNSGYAVNAETGAVTQLPSWSYSDYFKVVSGGEISLVNFSENVAGKVGIAFYETPVSGAFLSGVVYTSPTAMAVEVPADAKYCRFSVLTKKIPDYGFAQNIQPWIDGIESKASTAFDKTGIVTNGKNLFNKSTVTPERYLSAHGNPTYNANYCVSDFIPIEEGKTYQLSNTFGAGWVYDANKSPLHINSVANSFTAQTGEAYLRISVSNANVDIAQVEKSLYQSQYQSYGYKIDQSDLSFDEATSVPDNMFNPSVMSKGYMDGTTGNVKTSSADLWVTGFIGVEADKIYTVSGMWGSLCIYHADGSFSRNVASVGEEFHVATFQPVDDESFIRFTVTGGNKTKCKFEENIGYSKYTGAVSGVVNVDSIVGETEKITHVYVGSPCFFKTINAANNAISGNSKYNRFVIHIFEGTYNETFRTKDWVDYVGDNKHQCIIDYISDDESDYVHRSTIFAETNSKIANLTIKTTGSKYPIHADANYGLPYVVTIEDCIIKHDGYADTSIAPGGTGIGIGLHYDQHVIIRRCVVGGTTGVFGVAAVYCHNDNQNQNNWWARRERSLTIEDCILQDSYYGVRLDAIETVDGQDNDFIYIGNVNTCERPFLYNPGDFNSWHYFGLRNDPEYTPSN